MSEANRNSQSLSSDRLLPVAIVGGGPVGMSLALALSKQGIEAEIFEARERGPRLGDSRILALSHGTKQTLEWLGAWFNTDATPIHTIHVSQRGRLGRTIIRAGEEGLPALGYVSSLHELYKMLDKAVNAAGIPYHGNARIEAVDADARYASFLAGGEKHHARLIAYAEGVVDGAEKEGSRDYGQHAVTCVATLRDPHQGIAWERFTRHGPVALLPFGEAMAVVQTCPDAAAEVAALPTPAYIAQLQGIFGRRVAFAGGATPRRSFPLGLRYRHDAVAERQVWLGNAAQTLHPVAGQGFNLALRDVRELARVLAQASDPGAAEALNRYARRRHLDRRGTIGFTDTLARLFSNDDALLGHARGAGLLCLDLLPGARSFVARRMIYGARAWP